MTENYEYKPKQILDRLNSLCLPSMEGIAHLSADHQSVEIRSANNASRLQLTEELKTLGIIDFRYDPQMRESSEGMTVLTLIPFNQINTEILFEIIPSKIPGMLSEQHPSSHVKSHQKVKCKGSVAALTEEELELVKQIFAKARDGNRGELLALAADLVNTSNPNSISKEIKNLEMHVRNVPDLLDTYNNIIDRLGTRNRPHISHD